MNELYTLIDEVLYFSERKINHLHLCIPQDLINEILRYNHDLLEHSDIQRTYNTLIFRYYIPQMSRMIKRYINEYIIC